MGDEYGIYYQPQAATARVTAARRGLILRLVSMLISVGIFAALWAMMPEAFGAWAPWFLSASLVTGGSMAVVNLIAYRRASIDAESATQPLAIGLNREGLLIGQRWLSWAEVGSMVVTPGTLGASNSLVTTARDSSILRVPLELTDAMPASLDSVVRVLSGGLAFVDLSRLD